MAEHVWGACLNNRPGVRCTNCGLVAREAHQGWECPGGIEGAEKDSGIPAGFREWLGKSVDVAVSPKMAEKVWDGLPDWMWEGLAKKLAAPPIERIRPIQKSYSELEDEIASLLAIVEPLNRLRANEGASVEILCDNPEGPPRCAIRVSDDWTGEMWDFKRFEGDSLAECLKKAEEAKVAAEKGAQG